MTAEGTSGETLTDTLAALGFERISRLGATAWRGRYQGREGTITVSRQGRTRYAGEIRYRRHLGYRLRIELGTGVRTRFFFVKASVTSNLIVRWVYRWRRQVVVKPTLPELVGFHGVTRDVPWAQRLMAQRDAMREVSHLLTDGASPKLAGSVYFFPETLHYGSPILQGADITADRVVEVLQRLDAVAQAAERIEAPYIVSETSPFEGFAKRHPVATAFLLLGGCAGVLMVLGLLLVAVLALVAGSK